MFVLNISDNTGDYSYKATIVLTRLFSVVGQIAFCQLVFLEEDVLGEIKRRHTIQEENANKAKTPSGKKSKKRVSIVLFYV